MDSDRSDESARDLWYSCLWWLRLEPIRRSGRGDRRGRCGRRPYLRGGLPRSAARLQGCSPRGGISHRKAGRASCRRPSFPVPTRRSAERLLQPADPRPTRRTRMPMVEIEAAVSSVPIVIPARTRIKAPIRMITTPATMNLVDHLKAVHLGRSWIKGMPHGDPCRPRYGVAVSPQRAEARHCGRGRVREGSTGSGVVRSRHHTIIRLTPAPITFQ